MSRLRVWTVNRISRRPALHDTIIALRSAFKAPHSESLDRCPVPHNSKDHTMARFHPNHGLLQHFIHLADEWLSQLFPVPITSFNLFSSLFSFLFHFAFLLAFSFLWLIFYLFECVPFSFDILTNSFFASHVRSFLSILLFPQISVYTSGLIPRFLSSPPPSPNTSPSEIPFPLIFTSFQSPPQYSWSWAFSSMSDCACHAEGRFKNLTYRSFPITDFTRYRVCSSQSGYRPWR